MSFFLLSTLFPWILVVCLFMLALAFFLNLSNLIKYLHEIPWKYLVALCIIVLLGFLLRFYLSPNFHRIYYDEDRYLSYAVTFARFNQATSINLATPEKLVNGIPDEAGRSTVPVIHGLVLKIPNYSTEDLFQVAKMFSTAQIILIFFLTFLLFKNYLTASISALGMALIPTNIYWSPSLNLDTYAVFFALITLIGAALYAKNITPSNAILFLLSFLLLLGVRIESFVLLPVALFTIYAVRKTDKKPLFQKGDRPYIFAFILLITFRGFLSLSVLGQKWCCAEALPLEVFAFNYLIRNLLPNIFNFVLKPEFPFMISLFAAAALIYRPGVTKYILGLWIGIYFLLYSTYYAGNFFTYEFSGSYGRYFLMLIPGLLILAAVSITDILYGIKHKKIRSMLLFVIFMLSLTPSIMQYKKLVSSSPYYQLVEEGPKIMDDFLEKDVIPSTPSDSAIIHSLTAPILLSGRTSIYIGHFFEKEYIQNYVEELIINGKNVYIFESHTCDIFPRRCQRILEKFTFTPMKLSQGARYGLNMNKVTLKKSSQNIEVKSTE